MYSVIHYRETLEMPSRDRQFVNSKFELSRYNNVKLLETYNESPLAELGVEVELNMAHLMF